MNQFGIRSPQNGQAPVNPKSAPKEAMTRAELKVQRAQKKREEARLRLISERTRGNDYYRLARNGALKDVHVISKKFRRAYNVARFFSFLALFMCLALIAVLVVYKPSGFMSNLAGKIPAVKSWLDTACQNNQLKIGYLALLALFVIDFIGARAYGGREQDVKQGKELKKDVIINRPFARFVYILLSLALVVGVFTYDFFIYCGGDFSMWKNMVADPQMLWLRVANLAVMNFINLNIADEKFLAKRDQAKHERMALEQMDHYNGNIVYMRNTEDFKSGETGSYRNLLHVQILPTSYSVYLTVVIKNIITLLILHNIPSIKVMLVLSVFNVFTTFMDVKLTIRKQQKYENAVMNAIIRREQARLYSAQYDAWKSGRGKEPSMYRNQKRWLPEEQAMSKEEFAAHLNSEGYVTADSFYRKNCGKVPTRTDRFGKNKGVIYSKGYQDWQDDSDKYDVR